LSRNLPEQGDRFFNGQVFQEFDHVDLLVDGASFDQREMGFLVHASSVASFGGTFIHGTGSSWADFTFNHPARSPS